MADELKILTEYNALCIKYISCCKVCNSELPSLVPVLIRFSTGRSLFVLTAVMRLYCVILQLFLVKFRELLC